MKLRGYQQEAVDSVLEAFKASGSALLVMPTGTGKTVVFSHIIDHFLNAGRVMVLAHRVELINQAQEKIHTVTGDRPSIEMADQWSHEALSALYDRPGVVVSSIQTQVASARNGQFKRMQRFRPNDFSLVVVDEAHHATAASYRAVINHYRQNAKIKVLGVTATPDRTDEEALGQVFEEAPYVYEVLDAINDGWLVPIKQSSVMVESLDFSAVRTVAGDLNQGQLADIMEEERNLHEIAGPTMEKAGDRKTLCFTASVKHAERLSEIFNRHKPGSSEIVSAKTPAEERAKILQLYAKGEFQFLCNVGCFTEGFDEPGIEVVAIARPTKSRSLYAQMIGRGTRPLPGVLEDCETAEARKQAIEASAKPSLEVLDFSGNAGSHKLVTVADVLGGKCNESVVDAASAAMRKSTKPVDVAKELTNQTREAIERRNREEASQRRKLKAQSTYVTRQISPFDVFDIQPARARGWDRAKSITPKMRETLNKAGINTAGLSYSQAGQLCGEVIERWKSKRCSFKQAKVLKKYGYRTNVTFSEASIVIGAIKENGWKRPLHDPLAALEETAA